jgi:CHAD domain-containing protein
VGHAFVNDEREVKFEASLELELPDLRQHGLGVVQLPPQTLTTSYYDTPDLRLWERKITLRHRLGEGAGAGTWTLKLPGKPNRNGIDRTELSWPGRPGEIPPEAKELTRGIVRRQLLERVVVLESERRRAMVRSGSSPLGEIDDDTVAVADGVKSGFTFRQIEFELVPGPQGLHVDPAAIETVLTAIRRAGAHVDHEQKLAKAIGTAAVRRPAKKVGRGSTLGSVLQHAIEEQLGRLLEFDVQLRRAAANPSERAVHQARVATRRLRSDLKTFAPVLDPVWNLHTRSELAWIGALLGAVRDIDVFAKRLSTGAGTALESRGGDQLQALLAARRRAHSDELAHALRSDRYLNLLDRLHAGASSPRFVPNQQPKGKPRRALQPDKPARDALPLLVGLHWTKLRRRVAKAGSVPTDTQLHRIRIGSKQLRYGAEVAEAVVGKKARRTARRAEDVQTLLGDHHDSVTAVQWLEKIPASASTEASFVAGEFAADAHRRQAELREEWTRAWATLNTGRTAQWLAQR